MTGAPSPSDLERVATAFRTALLQRERVAAGEMIRAYQQVQKQLLVSLDRLLTRIQQAQANGAEVNADWLRRETRYRALLTQTEEQIDIFARFAEQRITTEQQAAVEAAAADASELIQVALGDEPPGVSVTFNRLPREATRELVGTLQDGSPLRALLDQLGPQASTAVRDGLVTGLAAGQGPREIARRIRQDLGGSAVWTLTLARTETLRAYRTTSLETYKANRDVTAGWIWHSALGNRTCALCWAMHGSLHDLDEPFASHINCRCSPMPRTKSWAELGFHDIPDAQPVIEPGEQIFDRLSDDDKQLVLGPGKFAAYKDGRLALTDLVAQTHDPRWGPGRRERSLRELQTVAITNLPRAARNQVREEFVDTAERSIRRRKAGETAYLFAPDGTLLFKRSEPKTEIRFSDEELSLMRGNILTHNHPGTRQGTSFSVSDVRLLLDYGLAEIRVVGGKYRHALRVPEGTAWTPQVERYIDGVTIEVLGRLNAAVRRRELARKDAALHLYHEVWTQVADRFGWEYTRTEWGE